VPKTIAAPTLSRRLGAYVTDLPFEAISSAAVEKARDHLVHHIGLAFTGHGQADGRRAVEIAVGLSAGAGSSTILGTARHALPLDAAFANCTLMRADGFDDVLFPAGVHAALVTIPVAFALGEQYHRSGREVLTAIIAGYDLIGKFGRTTWAWSADVPRRPTIPFGPFGAAAVAARLLRLDPEQAATALAYAAHSAMGLAEGALTTHYYSNVCRNGMMAAILAGAGGEAAPTTLEGRFGFFRTFFGGIPDDLEPTLATLGTEFEILHATNKRYPGTALNIVPIELLLELVRREGLTADQVERIDLWLPTERSNFADGHAPPPFPSRNAATSSLCFHLGSILADGRLDPARRERFDDPVVARQAAKIDMTLEPGHPIRYARLAVHLADGRVLDAEGDDFTFPRSEWLPTLLRDGERLVPAARLERALELISRLEEVEDIGELLACLRPSPLAPGR
jgi:2-methylcitrate dehydratase PrpD